MLSRHWLPPPTTLHTKSTYTWQRFRESSNIWLKYFYVYLWRLTGIECQVQAGSSCLFKSQEDSLTMKSYQCSGHPHHPSSSSHNKQIAHKTEICITECWARSPVSCYKYSIRPKSQWIPGSPASLTSQVNSRLISPLWQPTSHLPSLCWSLQTNWGMEEGGRLLGYN